MLLEDHNNNTTVQVAQSCEQLDPEAPGSNFRQEYGSSIVLAEVLSLHCYLKCKFDSS